jgi:hypothetical protein
LVVALKTGALLIRSLERFITFTLWPKQEAPPMNETTNAIIQEEVPYSPAPETVAGFIQAMSDKVNELLAAHDYRGVESSLA